MNYSKKPSKEAVEASNISFRTDRYRRYVSNISTQRENTETVLTSEINEWNTHRRTSDIPQFNSSIYPNFIFSNYNREFSKSLFGENKDSANAKIIDNESTMIKTMMTVDYSYKIVDMLDKMKNLLVLACKDPSIMYCDNKGNMANSDKVMFLGAFQSKNDFAEDFDVKSMNQVVFESFRKKFDLPITGYKEENVVENIYNGCFDLKEMIRSSIDDSGDNEIQTIHFQSTKISVNQIIQKSEKVVELYNKLFLMCFDSFAEIKANAKYSRDIEPLYTKNFTFNENKDTCLLGKDLLNINSINQDENGLKSNANDLLNNNDKETSIKEKIEKLRMLKEKKHQMLNQISSITDETKKIKRKTTIISENHDNIDTFKLRLPRRNSIFSEIETPDNILNENVFIKIPRSTYWRVKKPTDEINNIKFYKGEDEYSLHDYSHILINFDSLKNQYEEDIEKMEKVIKDDETNMNKSMNDTILDTRNYIIKNPKRSKSQIDESSTTIVKPKYYSFYLGFYSRRRVLKKATMIIII